MTIAKTDARKQYAGNDIVVAFSFPYRFFVDSDLQVYLLVDATGVETLQTLTTHYTVANNGDETGGTVTMVTAPATGETLTILRAIPQTQGTDYAANDPFPAETHEDALDRLTLLTQQLQEELGRALIAPASDSASVELPIERASSFLAFDASKNPIASAGGVSDVVVSTFMATVLDDLTAAAARTTLGAGVLDNIVEDTTPQLGGPLDTNSQAVYWSQGADVASATELLVLTDGNQFDVTGTTTIATIEDSADAWPIGGVIMLQFDGILILTHSANLSLIGGASITTAAGDWAVFQKYAAGDWRMSSFNGISATADWEAGTSTKPSLSSPANNAAAIAALSPISANTFKSSAQTITSASSVSISHGLGTIPGTKEITLVCTATDGTWDVGDTLFVDLNSTSAATSKHNALDITATTARLSFSPASSCFSSVSKGGAATVNLVNANWDLYIEVWL